MVSGTLQEHEGRYVSFKESERLKNKYLVTCDKIRAKQFIGGGPIQRSIIESKSYRFLSYNKKLLVLLILPLRVEMTKFRPCIDLHSGQVKQIVGGTLSAQASDLKTNYISKLPASHYADLYKQHDLRGGHVVMLGPGNTEAAKEALKTWPNGLQVAGGITDENASYWIEQGAEKVSYVKPIAMDIMIKFTIFHLR